MSHRFPVCSAKDVAKVLRRNGFGMVSQRGSHQKWRHPDGRQVILADHGNRAIPLGTLKSLIQGSGLAVDLFE